MSAVTSVANSGNAIIDALTWGSRWGDGVGKQVITVGYTNNNGTLAPTTNELNAIKATLAAYEKIINVDFQLVGVDNSYLADITFNFVNDPASGNYGFAQPPGEGEFGGNGNENSSVVIYRNNYLSGLSATLKPGSHDYVTIVHEFGHALGLAHPHDDGGTTSDPSQLFHGVTAEFGDYGTANLNQGVYTTMSYNDGWKLAAAKPTSALNGYQTGPMALDIMALQHIYGANTTHNSTSTSYVLASTAGTGTGYTTIWDTGGTDTISVSSTLTAGVVIDLRAATGAVAAGGGGYVSYVKGVAAGFTIAKGVVIERANGGAGADTMYGNSANNVLTGNNGKDSLYGGGGADIFDFNRVTQTGLSSTTADLIKDFSTVYDRIDLRTIDASISGSGDQAFAFKGTAAFTGSAQVRYVKSGGDTFVYLNTDSDKTAEAVIRLTGLKTLMADDFLL
jgi:serralysin